MSVVDAINAMEVVWWIGCGLVVLSKSLRSRSSFHNHGIVAGITLILFGLSDVIELQTGAWWRPWWLLVWKGICISMLVICSVIHVRHNAARGGTSPKSVDDGRTI